MYDALNNLMEQSKSLIAPAVKANKLAVNNLEKLTQFQLTALRGYVDLGLARLKAASEVDDLKGLQAFYAGQVDALSTLRQKMFDDAKALTELGTGFKAEFDKLAEEAASELPKAMQAITATGLKAA